MPLDNILFGPNIDLNEYNLPIVLFVGRSNVGKSSIIRLLTGKRVRVGKHSGTTHIPVAIFMDNFWIVDMPGIGFSAKRSKIDSFKISESVISFIERHKNCDLMSFIIEDISFPKIYKKLISKGIDPISILLVNYLQPFSVSLSIILNKIDKVKRKERIDLLDDVATIFGLERWSPKSHFIIPFSAKTKDGLSELNMLIDSFINKK